MEVTYRDGSKLFCTRSATETEALRVREAEHELYGAMEHAPGSVVTMASGAQYEVGLDGAWKRLPKRS